MLALDSQKLEHSCLPNCLLTGTLFGFNLMLVSDEIIFFFFTKNNVLFKQNFIQNALRKIPAFHVTSWCGNFVERHSFRRVSGESAEAAPFHKITTPGY